MGESDLPRELLSVLPANPYDQLDIARRITAMAVSSRVDRLEVETSSLRQKLAEKELLVSNLHAKIVELEQAVQATNARLSDALDEQAKLTMQKNALAVSVKKLNRDLAKLETFKKTLMQSLQEEEEIQLQTGDAKWLASKALEAESSSIDPPNKDSRISNPGTYSLTSPDLTPKLSLSGSPTRRHSTTVSPRARSTVTSSRAQSTKGSPKWHSVADGRLSLPASLSASKHSTAPNSPPNAQSHTTRTARVDGKEFFKQARNRLSYEQFSAFLTNIKELNAHKQTREETLRRANEIFGPDNEDLYHAFDSLLNRHLPGQG